MHFVLITLFFALIAGLSEAAVLLFRREVLQQFIWVGTDVAWMAGISYAVFFLPIGILGALAARRWPAAAYTTVVFVFVLCLVLMLLDVSFGSRIHIAARALLAVGAAAQVARWWSARRGAAARRLQRPTAGLALVVALLAAGVNVARAASERASVSRLGAAQSGAPNVLLLILDTVRAASLGLYGNPRGTTPELERFAARGVVFDRAIAPAPWTLPSHASMFTGRLPHEMSADWFTPLDERDATLAEALRDRGYETAAFMANYLYTTPETGLDRGFLRFSTYPISWRQVLLSSSAGQYLEQLRTGVQVNERKSERKNADVMNRDFLRWVGRERTRPFFAVINYFDAHRPYYAVPPFAERFGTSRKDQYEASIAYLDAQLGNLFRELETRGMLQNTIVLVTSDHGELFGEAGGSAHGGKPFFRVLHVPLLIAGPGIPAEKRVPEPVTLKDLPATVLDLVAAGEPQRFPGAPLTQYWRGGVPERRPVLSEARTESAVRLLRERAEYTLSLVEDSLHYIRYPDGKEQLFNYVRDEEERNELVRSPPGDDLVRVRALLDALLAEAKTK